VRIEVPLPPDDVLARLRQVLRRPNDESDAFDLLARPVYGGVSENRFTMRRAPLPWIKLHGEFAATVVQSEHGRSLVRIQRRGLDWGLLYSILPFSATIFASQLVREPELAEISPLLIGLGAISFAIGVYCIAVVLLDWRHLRARLLGAFPEMALAV